MSFAGFMNDRCDIYHLRRRDEEVGYGVPPGTSFYYEDEPDEADVPCHFARRGGGNILVEGVPQHMLEGTIKLNLPYDVDIQRQDKVVDKRTNLEYTAAVPQNIQTHHIAVMLYRLRAQEAI